MRIGTTDRRVYRHASSTYGHLLQRNATCVRQGYRNRHRADVYIEVAWRGVACVAWRGVAWRGVAWRCVAVRGGAWRGGVWPAFAECAAWRVWHDAVRRRGLSWPGAARRERYLVAPCWVHRDVPVAFADQHPGMVAVHPDRRREVSSSDTDLEQRHAPQQR